MLVQSTHFWSGELIPKVRMPSPAQSSLAALAPLALKFEPSAYVATINAGPQQQSRTRRMASGMCRINQLFLKVSCPPCLYGSHHSYCSTLDLSRGNKHSCD